MVPKLLVLALEFTRAPLRFGHLTDTARPLPDAFGAWLTEASLAVGPNEIQSTAETLGVGTEELREAFAFFLRQTLLLPQADHYRVLGLSRRCGADAIKRHHSLLVRMFHPDRMPGGGERNVALTARINRAYHTLRDLDARRCYDSQLGLLPDSVRPVADTQSFFRPRDPIPSGPRGAGTFPFSPFRGRRLLLFALASLATTALLLLAVREPGRTSLQVNPESARGRASGPAYLNGLKEAAADNRIAWRSLGSHPSDATPTPVQNYRPAAQIRAGQDVRAASSARPPESAAAATETGLQDSARDAADVRGTFDREALDTPAAKNLVMTPPPSTPIRAEPKRSDHPRTTLEKPENRESRTNDRTGPGATATERGTSARAANFVAASLLIRRLEASYANSDLPGLLSLFTANAVVNGGVGKAVIRRKYSDTFARTNVRRMSIGDLRWRVANDERLVGAGDIRIGRRTEGGAGWRYSAGTIRLELVPWIGEYRISKLIHRFPH